MANQFITTDKVAFEALDVLENTLGFSGKVNRSYDGNFAQEGGKIGATLNVPKPPRYTVGSGPVIDPQAITETYVPVTITDQLHVPVSVTSADYALSLNDFRSRVIAPAMAALSNQIDYLGMLRMAQATNNCVGVPGQISAGTASSAQAIAAIAAAGQRLDEGAAPMDADRYACISPATNTGLVQAHSSLFNPSSTIGEQFKRGRVGNGVLGFDFYQDQNTPNFTAGTMSAAFTNAVNGAQGLGNTVQANADTSFTLTINAITGTLVAGQSITISGCYDVNPQNRQPTASLKNFVVVQDVASSGTSVKILPYPVFEGPFKNCHATGNQFANNATISSLQGYSGAIYPANLLFHKNAYTLATCDMPLPKGNGEASRASSKAAGLSIRFVKNWYDARTDQFITRFDVLIGWKMMYPELCTKLVG